MYFSFTTLSTVGFGDLYPVADVERFIAIFILLFGVAMFTIIKDNFCQILFSFMDLRANFDDSDNINMFLSMLERNNSHRRFTFEYRCRIQNYFDFRWKTDNN